MKIISDKIFLFLRNSGYMPYVLQNIIQKFEKGNRFFSNLESLLIKGVSALKLNMVLKSKTNPSCRANPFAW